ncbi:MAG TPA: phosphatase PAP2 family protein [Sedimentisphaerales bacterium]|jgi:membrane-associated phospholipid phosphatase|nr:phosphatase PAP2 family protein [Sedimentisphaerales bacterium]HNU28529.1 phosphatase PAP2 family protein [Sedimentisphaerales bacterium]
MSRWFDKLLWFCVLALALPAGAAEPSATPVPAGWFDAAKADLRVFPDRLMADAKATFFNGDNLALLAWAGLASVAMNNGNADDDVADHFAKHDTFGTFSEDALFIIGSPVTHFAGTALWYFLDADRGDDPGRQKAVTMLSALTITATVTGGLKMIRDNDQPDGQSWAWPSGHTSSSVAVASVLHEFYGLKVGLPAYAVAGVVAWRMMDDGDHWASDVLFGATLGWVVGHTVGRRHGYPEIGGFEIEPYYGNPQTPAVGISLARRF